MADLFSKMARRGKKVFAITETVAEDRLLEPPEFQGHWDPHVWGDPTLWAASVDAVVKALVENDAAGKDGYEQRGAGLKKDSSTWQPGPRAARVNSRLTDGC